MTFRLKLALAMALLVATGSLATLLIVQRRVTAFYDANFRAQFERQIAWFLALQETRLASVKSECLKLSQKVRIVAALSEQEIPGEILYDVTDDEMKALLGGMLQEARLASVSAPARMGATFFRFLDAQGRPISPPENIRRRLGFPLNRRRLEEKLAQIRGALDHPEPQQVGYLALSFETNRAGLALAGPVLPSRAASEERSAPVLQEVIVTKVLDPDSSQVLGALVLGFPLSELIPQIKAPEAVPPAARPDPIQAGILLEEHLYAGTQAIPEPLAAGLTEELGRRILQARKPQDDFQWRIGGSYYRVFYELLNPNSGFPPAYQVCLYPMAQARREQARLRWQILGSGAGALLGALVLGLFLSHGLSGPIRDLVGAAGEIERGNFAVKVPVRSHDELGQLAVSFNEMAQGLAQKERYRTVLNQVADERVARQLLSGEITLGGEVRQASVLFCDIRGFTDLTEHMPPGEVIEMINEHMSALTPLVRQHNGVLDKFVGDLLMAIFGAPVSHDHDAVDAARCALALVRERERLNQTSRHRLKVGLGLATGKVVAGGMGSADRLHYTVLGERVNLASRLCGLAGPGEVLIDQTTRNAVVGVMVAEPMAPASIKGFAAPVPVFRLMGIKDGQSQTQ